MAEQITHVSVTDENGSKHLTKDEWFKMPVPDRVKIILQNKARFLNGDQLIPVRQALRLLKELG